ncbi:hypothetical protein AKJ41_05940 [candidate division MSBL1 archaeon SCGC-AAA259O05]|uniref:Uncharacterized protein n=1 Tax=candidate division MSBL1 archaeon SCGC-AAA259O05 TaxID=1698271 RepID=A0A133UY51_9EURY|nr:hypothetical protein AKJ41_05940 [candidate division MSBL1 archaeon SCGC-AAA259O05]
MEERFLRLRKMIPYLGLIIQLILIFLGLFWINRDTREKGIDRKYYWIWSILLIAALLILGIIGIILTVLGYYLWSRHMY